MNGVRAPHPAYRTASSTTPVTGVDPTVRLARNILLVYATIYYFLPMALTVLFGQPLEDVLAGPPNYFLGSAFIVFIVLLTWFGCSRVKASNFAVLHPVAAIAFNRFAILGVASVALLLSYWFAQEHGLSFRQTGERIGAAGGSVIALMAAQNYLLAAMVLLLGMSEERVRAAGWPVTAALALTALGSFLALASAYGVVTIAISLLLLLRSAAGVDLLKGRGVARTVATVTALAVVGICALFVGIANKLGVDTAVYMFTEDIQSVIDRFQYRISWHFYSACYHVTYNFADFRLGFQAVQELVTVVGHRVDVVLGNPTYFNEIASVRRLNWEELALVYRERTGASPGMIAGVFFVPGGILMLPLTISIYCILLSMLAKAVQGRQLSLFAIIFLVVWFTGIADSALDLLNPLDPSFLKLVFLALVCAFHAPARAAESGARAGLRVASPLAQPSFPATRQAV